MKRPDLLFFALIALLTATPLRAEMAAFDASTVGGPGSGRQGELFRPAGAAPSGVVIVLHGCDGVGAHYRIWAARLAQWGYAALLVDSFTGRGFKEVCNRGRLVPGEAQARDAFDAAAYLRTLPDLAGRRFGVIGYSHGGWAVMKAVLAGVARRPDEPAFAAAVAYYPGCDPPGSPLETDTLVLIGDADDWSPPGRCERWRDQVDTAGHVLELRLYPGALHGFDSAAPPHYFVGHHVGREPVAAEDAENAARAFFAARLGP
jgi:dienelactone hydrolase